MPPATFGWHTIQIGTFGIVGCRRRRVSGRGSAAGSTTGWDRKRVISGSMLVLLLALAAILLVDKEPDPVREGGAARPPAVHYFAGRRPSAPIS